MVITCPNCSKRYLVEDMNLSLRGRQVQCAACQHTWFYIPTQETLDLNQDATDALGLHRTQKNDRTKSALGWVFLALSILTILMALFIGRHSVMQLWPHTTKVYKVLGLQLPENLDDLKIEGLRPMIEPTPHGQKVFLTGTIINEGSQAHEIKKLTIYVKGDCAHVGWFWRLVNKYVYREPDNTCIIDQWIYEPSESKIYPNERLSFETSSRKELQGAKSIQVKF